MDLDIGRLAYLVILITMPLVVTFATISVAVAVYRRCRPWPVAVRGWGSAVMLVGYVIFNYDHETIQAVALAMAIVLVGLALAVIPFVWRTAKHHTENNPLDQLPPNNRI